MFSVPSHSVISGFYLFIPAVLHYIYGTIFMENAIIFTRRSDNNNNRKKLLYAKGNEIKNI